MLDVRKESGSPNRYIKLPEIKNDFDIFDQKSHFAFGEHRLGYMLKPESLMLMDLPNEQSYQEQRINPFGDINQVSYNSRDDSFEMSVYEDNESNAIHPVAKRYHEDDLGLRVANTIRRDFANNQLFKSRQRVLVEEDMSSDEYYSEAGDTFYGDDASFPQPDINSSYEPVTSPCVRFDEVVISN